jgi:hypothetical protein
VAGSGANPFSRFQLGQPHGSSGGGGTEPLQQLPHSRSPAGYGSGSPPANHEQQQWRQQQQQQQPSSGVGRHTSPGRGSPRPLHRPPLPLPPAHLHPQLQQPSSGGRTGAPSPMFSPWQQQRVGQQQQQQALQGRSSLDATPTLAGSTPATGATGFSFHSVPETLPPRSGSWGAQGGTPLPAPPPSPRPLQQPPPPLPPGPPTAVATSGLPPGHTYIAPDASLVDKHLIMYRLKPLLKRRMAEGLLNRETYKQARGCADLGWQLRLVLGGDHTQLKLWAQGVCSLYLICLLLLVILQKTTQRGCTSLAQKPKADPACNVRVPILIFPPSRVCRRPRRLWQQYLSSSAPPRRSPAMLRQR